MRFLIDEDVSPKLTGLLEEFRHSAIHIRDIQISLKDYQILKIALSQAYIVITEDKDFGELVFKNRQSHNGVILLRLEDQTVDNSKRAVTWFLSNYLEGKIIDNFAVVSEKEGKFKARFKK